MVRLVRLLELDSLVGKDLIRDLGDLGSNFGIICYNFFNFFLIDVNYIY